MSSGSYKLRFKLLHWKLCQTKNKNIFKRARCCAPNFLIRNICPSYRLKNRVLIFDIQRTWLSWSDINFWPAPNTTGIIPISLWPTFSHEWVKCLWFTSAEDRIYFGPEFGLNWAVKVYVCAKECLWLFSRSTDWVPELRDVRLHSFASTHRLSSLPPLHEDIRRVNTHRSLWPTLF